MIAVKRSRTRGLLRLSGLVCLLAIAAAHASDNSKSTLDVPELLVVLAPVATAPETPPPEVAGRLANEPMPVQVGVGKHTVQSASGSTYTVSLPGVDVIKVPVKGSSPISNTPPPPISASALGLTLQGGAVIPKPPSLQALKQQLAAQQQVLAEQQAALTSAQATLAVFQAQANPLSPNYAGPDNQQEVQSFVATWTQAVATDQHLVAAVQAQIAQLQAQIAAAQ